MLLTPTFTADWATALRAGKSPISGKPCVLKAPKIENVLHANDVIEVYRCECRGLSRHQRYSRWTTEDRPKSQGMPSAADQSQ
jgi:hypothetical protein